MIRFLHEGTVAGELEFYAVISFGHVAITNVN